jgi:hypothetical protein
MIYLQPSAAARFATWAIMLSNIVDPTAHGLRDE